MIDKNTDIEIQCSASLAPSLPGEECSGSGIVEVRFKNDDCAATSRPYTYCIEDKEDATTLYIPPVHSGYRLDFVSTGLQGITLNLYTTKQYRATRHGVYLYIRRNFSDMKWHL